MSRELAGIGTGSVIRYPYLWVREAARGETAGRKERPVAVVVRLQHAGRDVVLLLAITSQPPLPSQDAVEIPTIERKRAGLDPDMRLWVVLDEYNSDEVGKSFYLPPQRPMGEFSRAFFGPVFERFVANLHARTRIDRRL